MGRKKLIDIIFENDDLVVLNKPAGLLTIPDRFNKKLFSLSEEAKKVWGEIYIVHRLDRDTSGLIVFAKNAEVHKKLNMMFENGEIKKTYKAIVTGKVTVVKGIIEAPIKEDKYEPGKMMIHKKGKESITEFELVNSFQKYSVMKLIPKTGRTHQIRVHLAHIGYPVAADALYGTSGVVFLSWIKPNYKEKRFEDEKPLLSRHGLHSWKLEIPGFSNIPKEFEAPLPKDMRAVINQLTKESKKETGFYL